MQESISSILQNIRAKLKNLYPSNEIDAFIFMIFEQELGISSTKVLAYPEQKIQKGDVQNIENIVKGLVQKKPIQYLLGKAHFYDLEFYVDNNVLIPRPETEELVHWILADHDNSAKKILDVGTGSGAIAVSLKKNRAQWNVNAIDISKSALAIAEKNAQLNHVAVHYINEDALQKHGFVSNTRFDIIVSNPPYVCELEKKLMDNNVLDYEPHLALFVNDNDPLLFYRKIANHAFNQLNEGGNLYFEINEKFGKESCELLNNIGFRNCILKKDLNNKDRMIKAEKIN